MNKPETVLKKRHRILWDFKIQKNQYVSSGRYELVFINKKKKP